MSEVIKIPRCVAALVWILFPATGIGDVQTAGQAMALSISPAGKLSVPGVVTLASNNMKFGMFQGNLVLSYWARTGSAGGSITAQASSDFTPAGGPAITAVTYTCSGATMGAACSGSYGLSISAQTPVAYLPGSSCTGGGGDCSSQDPNSVQLWFSAPNLTHYKTGTYSAQVTFTISSI
jgi:hypothetical protein